MPQMRAVMSGTSCKIAADQKAFEEARRLVDIQADFDGLAVLQADIQAAFAFDARQGGNFDGLHELLLSLAVKFERLLSRVWKAGAWRC